MTVAPSRDNTWHVARPSPDPAPGIELKQYNMLLDCDWISIIYLKLCYESFTMIGGA